LVSKIDGLIENPFPPKCTKLSGHASLWRIRVGDYRIIDTVGEVVLQVLVIEVGHRREIYRDY